MTNPIEFANSTGIWIRFTGPVPGGTPGGGGGEPDPLPTVSWGVSMVSVAETAARAVLSLELSAPHTVPVRITVEDVSVPAAAGGATPGVDYEVTRPVVVIPAGATSVPFLVDILPTVDVDGMESVDLLIVDAVEDLGDLRQVPLGTPTAAEVVITEVVAPLLPVVTFEDPSIVLREGESGSVDVVLSAPSSTPVVVSIVWDSGSATPNVDFSFTRFVTIPAGELRAPCSISVFEDEDDESPAERANLRIAEAEGATVGAASVLLLGIPEEPAPTGVAPVVGWGARFFTITDGATNRTATVTVGITNLPPWAPFDPIVVDIVIHGSTTGTLTTEYTLSTQQVTLTAAAPTAEVTIQTVAGALSGQETVRLDLSIDSGGPASLDAAFTSLIGILVDASTSAGNEAELAVEPVGTSIFSDLPGYSAPSLVWVPMPLATPAANIDEVAFNIDGYGCDAFPMAWDPESGDIDQVMLVANVPASSGRPSLPGVNGGGVMTVTEGPGTIAEVLTLKSVSLDGLYLELRPSYDRSQVFRAYLAPRPEHNEVNPCELARVVELDGQRVRRTRITYEFHREGTDGSARANRMLNAVVWVTERADYACAELTIAIINGRVSRTASQYVANTNGDGPVYFESIGLYGLGAVGGRELVLFQDRPLNHFREAGVVWLASRPNGSSTDQNKLNPGGWFGRRMAIYNTATVPTSIARDIVNQKGKGAYATGDIGFTEGGYMGAGILPKVEKLPPLRSLHANPYGAQMVQGYEDAARMRNEIANEPLRYNTQGIRHLGWAKPWGEPDPGQGGQNDMELWGGELVGSVGYLQRLMLRCDGMIERQYLATMCIETWKPLTFDDFTSQTSGQLPYAFSPIGTTPYFHIAHNRYPRLTGRNAWATRLVDELAPTSHPWNVLGPEPQTCTFEAFYNVQHNGQGLWGPQKKTHLSRFFATTLPLYQMTMDPLAGLALEFEGFSSLCAVPHVAINASRPWRRHDYAVGHGNLPYIISDALPDSNAGNGYFKANDDGRGGYQSHTPRILSMCMAAVMMQLYFGRSEVRAAIDKNGDTTSWCTLAGTVLEHVIGGNGLASSHDDLNTPDTYFPEYLPNFTTRTGSVPHPDLHGGSAWWPVSQARHNTYWGLVYPLLQRALRRDVGRASWLDLAFKHLDTIDKAVQVHRPDGEFQYPVFMHISEGTAGHQNTAMTLVDAQGGDGVWFQMPDVLDPSGTYYPHRAPAEVPGQAWMYYWRFGQWDDVKRCLKRQFGVAPSTITDSQLVEYLWQSVQETITIVGRRYECRGYMLTLGALLKSGATYPTGVGGAPEPLPPQGRRITIRQANPPGYIIPVTGDGTPPDGGVGADPVEGDYAEAPGPIPIPL